ncbi:MAG: CCA tRNA nucleotidyltransferase, partial [Rhodobacteraceae bacterium]
RAVGAAPGWPRRAGFLGAWAADWRLSRAEARRLAALRAALESAEPVAAAAQRHGADAARDAALIRAAQGAALPPSLEAEALRGAEAAFPVRAADLAARGVAGGPAMGAALAALREKWIASDFALDRAALLDALEG